MRNYLLFVFTATLAISVEAASTSGAPVDQSPHIASASGGAALSLPSHAAPAAIVSTYLHSHGYSNATVNSLVTESVQQSSRTGVWYVHMSQEIAGLWVYDTYVKAAVNGDGELVHLIENLAAGTGKVNKAAIDEAEALQAALTSLGINAGPGSETGRSNNTVSYARGSAFLEPPSVTRVAVPMADGSMKTGFVVTVWTRNNLLYETLVGGNGRVLSTQLRTNSDSYNSSACICRK